jgi:hypothetical protein
MKTFSIFQMSRTSTVVIATASLVASSSVWCDAQSVQIQKVQTVPQVRTEDTVTRETRVDGRLHLTGPESVSIQVGTASPTTYRYGTAVQFVDDAGNVVVRDRIAPGTPVTVYTLPQPAGGIVTNRVVVHTSTVATPVPGGQAVTTKVTETTQERTNVKGVVLEKEPDRVLVRTEQEGDVTFRYSRVTDFIDSEGAHVDLIKIVPGLPVQVDFKQVGDRLEASRIIVRGRIKN